jgi:hypothetical protein
MSSGYSIDNHFWVSLSSYFWELNWVTIEFSNSDYFSLGSNYQQISALEPNLTMKLNKLCAEILIIKSTTHKAFKTLSCIKIYPLELKISLIVLPKTCEIGWKCDVDFSRFHTFFGLQLKISRVPGVRFWYKIAFWKLYEL